MAYNLVKWYVCITQFFFYSFFFASDRQIIISDSVFLLAQSNVPYADSILFAHSIHFLWIFVNSCLSLLSACFSIRTICFYFTIITFDGSRLALAERLRIKSSFWSLHCIKVISYDVFFPTSHWHQIHRLQTFMFTLVDWQSSNTFLHANTHTFECREKKCAVLKQIEVSIFLKPMCLFSLYRSLCIKCQRYNHLRANCKWGYLKLKIPLYSFYSCQFKKKWINHTQNERQREQDRTLTFDETEWKDKR